MKHTDLSGLRVLVTGATGFIGTALYHRLRTAGAETHVVLRPVCDVTNSERVAMVMQAIRPQVVYHLAAMVTGSQDRSLILPMLQTNFLGFVNVALAAAEAGCERIITAGSLVEPEAEEAPASPYAAAKGAASLYARMFAQLHGMPVTIARLHMVYGPGQLDYSKLVPHVIRGLLAGKPVELSSGRQAFDWVYVEDVVEGLLRMATAPGLEGLTVEIGTGSLTAVADIARELARRLGAPDLLRFGALPDRKFEPTRTANVGRTQHQLGWRPQVDVQAGLDATAEWYRAL
jgi:nucleoside-diphosphate-sugar epimerase